MRFRAFQVPGLKFKDLEEGLKPNLILLGGVSGLGADALTLNPLLPEPLSGFLLRDVCCYHNRDLE